MDLYVYMQNICSIVQTKFKFTFYLHAYMILIYESFSQPIKIGSFWTAFLNWNRNSFQHSRTDASALHFHWSEARIRILELCKYSVANSWSWRRQFWLEAQVATRKKKKMKHLKLWLYCSWHDLWRHLESSLRSRIGSQTFSATSYHTNKTFRILSGQIT